MDKKSNGIDYISIYTQQQAVEDGILVITGYAGKVPVIFTNNLFRDGYEDKFRREWLVNLGLSLLSIPKDDDSPSMKLRVIKKNAIWVIQDPEGITFMKPEDY